MLLQEKLAGGHHSLHRFPDCLFQLDMIRLLKFLQLGRWDFLRASSCVIQLMRSMSLVLVVKFWVVTKVLQDDGSAPSRMSLYNFDSISTPQEVQRLGRICLSHGCEEIVFV